MCLSKIERIWDNCIVVIVIVDSVGNDLDDLNELWELVLVLQEAEE